MHKSNAFCISSDNIFRDYTHRRIEGPRGPRARKGCRAPSLTVQAVDLERKGGIHLLDLFVTVSLFSL